MIKNSQLTRNKRNFIVILKAGMVCNTEILNALHVQLGKNEDVYSVKTEYYRYLSTGMSISPYGSSKNAAI